MVISFIIMTVVLFVTPIRWHERPRRSEPPDRLACESDCHPPSRRESRMNLKAKASSLGFLLLRLHSHSPGSVPCFPSSFHAPAKQSNLPRFDLLPSLLTDVSEQRFRSRPDAATSRRQVSPDRFETVRTVVKEDRQCLFGMVILRL